MTDAVTVAASGAARPACAPRCAASALFFRRAPLSAFWGVIAALIVAMAIAAPLIAPYPPLKSDFRAMQKPPTRSTGSAPTRSAATP